MSTPELRLTFMLHGSQCEACDAHIVSGSYAAMRPAQPPGPEPDSLQHLRAWYPECVPCALKRCGVAYRCDENLDPNWTAPAVEHIAREIRHLRREVQQVLALHAPKQAEEPTP